MRTFQIAEPGGPDVLRFAPAPVPAAGPGQVLIRVAFAGLNFTDVLARRGAPGYASVWPFVPGMEVAGIVEALGDDVAGFAAGDTVVAFTPDGGGFAEVVAADARLTAVVPAGIGLAAATTLPLTWATAVGLSQRSHAGPGDSVLVTSAGGGVGVALAAVLARAGVAQIVGGAGSDAKAQALPAGVVPVVRGDGFYARAVDAAGGPFDLVLDSVGGEVLAGAAYALANGGRLISYGGAAGQPDPEAVAFAALRTSNLTVSGFSMLRLARTVPERVQVLLSETLAQVADGLALTAPTVISWDELPEAHVHQSEGLAVGKVVVAVS